MMEETIYCKAFPVCFGIADYSFVLIIWHNSLTSTISKLKSKCSSDMREMCTGLHYNCTCKKYVSSIFSPMESIGAFWYCQS